MDKMGRHRQETSGGSDRPGFLRNDVKRARFSGSRRAGPHGFGSRLPQPPPQPPPPLNPAAKPGTLTGREIALRIRRKTGAANTDQPSPLSGFFGGDDVDELVPRKRAGGSSLMFKPGNDEIRPQMDDRQGHSTTSPAAKIAQPEDSLEVYMSGITRKVHTPQEANSKANALLLDDDNRPESTAEPGRLLSEDEDEEYEAQGSDDEGWLSKSRRKRLAYEKVDHGNIDYQDFKKEFYIEAPELSRMTKEEVTAYRRSLGGVRIRGQNCPKPVKSWGQCGLQTAVLDVLRRLEFSTPTGVQAQAIPCVMGGRDVIGVARTGSGKTLAFVLPMLRHIAAQPRLATGDGPIGLVIAPTRELAIQIYNDTRKFAKVLQMRCVCAYGGSGIGEQISEIKRGAEMVVCTPGRMIDLLAMNSGRVTNLRRCTMVVLDEADRMFDMGFEPQVTRIVENIRPDRQAVMFSATFPQQVEHLARKILHKPVEIAVGGHSVAASSIDQYVEVRSQKSKFLRLLELLGVWHEKGAVLIFVDRQDSADRLFQDLVKAAYKKTLVLHGGMDQADRDSAISDFKNGVAKILVATSVAARGLDVKGLRLVVNYDTPNHYEDYVHRVGRTGRAGSKGTAYTFVTPEQDMYAPDLVKALELSAKSAYEAENPTVKKGDSGLAEAMKQVVCDELRELVARFQEKRNLGLVKFTPGSGFGGKGFKFDQEEETAHQVLQRAHVDDRSDDKAGDRKKSSAPADDDEGVVVREIVSGKSTAELKSTEPQARPSAPIPVVEKSLSERLATGVAQVEKDGKLQGLSDDVIKARIAKTKADILVSEVPRPKAAVHHSGAGAGKTAKSGALLEAQNAASVISRQLGGSGPEAEPSGTTTERDVPEVVKKFATELEINDYPQHARWKVTHKGSLTDVEEDTSTAVTTKGNFYAPGRNPPDGERKLFLLIEGPDEHSVRAARREVKQRLEDAAEARPEEKGAYGKYSVM